MKYGGKLLNKKANPLIKKKEVKFKVSLENETQMCDERLTKLGIILKIKDDPVNKFFYYDGKVDGESYRSVAAYKQSRSNDKTNQKTAKINRRIDNRKNEKE